jgi:uncharacterized coiled-coil protein SlyX
MKKISAERLERLEVAGAKITKSAKTAEADKSNPLTEISSALIEQGKAISRLAEQSAALAEAVGQQAAMQRDAVPTSKPRIFRISNIIRDADRDMVGLTVTEASE